MTANSFISALSAVSFVITQNLRVWALCSRRSLLATEGRPATTAALAAAKLFS
jgi:hypothetical protein